MNLLHSLSICQKITNLISSYTGSCLVHQASSRLEISNGLEMLNATAQPLNHSCMGQRVLWKLGGVLSEQG